MGAAVISVPDKGRLTLEKAFELLRELDHYAGYKAGAQTNPVVAVEHTRAALASHIAESLARKDRRR